MCYFILNIDNSKTAKSLDKKVYKLQYKLPFLLFDNFKIFVTHGQGSWILIFVSIMKRVIANIIKL